MSTILAVGFAIVSLLSTPPMAHAVTKNVPVDPGDPVARAYRRTLETPANSAITGQLPSYDSSNPAVTAEPNDPIAIAFRRSLENPANSITTQQTNESIMRTLDNFDDSAITGQSHDPVAMAFRRSLEDPANFIAIGLPDDPIAMAFRRSLGTTNNNIDPVDGETPNDLNTLPAVNQLPIRMLMRFSKGKREGSVTTSYPSLTLT